MCSPIFNSDPGFEKRGEALRKDMNHVKNKVIKLPLLGAD